MNKPSWAAAAVYNRYGDISKFITDPNRLEIADGKCVYISGEKDYDVAVDLEGCYDTFENVKQFITLIAKHVCEMDNIVLRFHNNTRLNGKPLKYAKLPAPEGILRYDYSKCIEKTREQQGEFNFILSLIFIEKPNFVTFDYWATNVNDQLNADFEYKDGRFYLRTYGMIDLIPDDWDSDLTAGGNML